MTAQGQRCVVPYNGWPQSRIVREDNSGQTVRHPREGANQIGANRCANPSLRAGRIARSHNRQLRGATLNDERFVDEHVTRNKAPQFARHVGPACVHIVIARNHEHTERRGERAEVLCVDGDVFRAIINQIAGDRNDVCVECANRAHDALEKRARTLRANVQVGQLHNAQAIKRWWQILHSRLDVPNNQRARAEVTDQKQYGRANQHCERQQSSQSDGHAKGPSQRQARHARQRDKRQGELRVQQHTNHQHAEQRARVEGPAQATQEHEEWRRGVHGQCSNRGRCAGKQTPRQRAKHRPTEKQIDSEVGHRSGIITHRGRS